MCQPSESPNRCLFLLRSHSLHPPTRRVVSDIAIHRTRQVNPKTALARHGRSGEPVLDVLSHSTTSRLKGMTNSALTSQNPFIPKNRCSDMDLVGAKARLWLRQKHTQVQEKGNQHEGLAHRHMVCIWSPWGLGATASPEGRQARQPPWPPIARGLTPGIHSVRSCISIWLGRLIKAHDSLAD
jgi:hypothetical protein